MNSKKFSAESARGAVFLHFAIILPVFVLIIFFFIEMARYLTVRSALSNGADEAVSLATRIEDLDDPSDAAKFAAAESKVLERATLIAGSYPWVNKAELDDLVSTQNIRLILPSVPKKTLAQAFAELPVRVTINAQIEPLFPYFSFFFPRTVSGGIPIEVRALAYRETRKVAALPVPFDCNGIPQGSPDYLKYTCPCPNDKYWSATVGKCLCYQPYGYDGECHCASDTMELDSAGRNCVCKSGGELGCGEYAQTASGNGVDGVVECGCACPAGLVPVGGDATQGCTCEGSRTVEATGGSASCVCTNSCTGGKEPDDSDPECSCVCPAGTTASGDLCVCNDPNYEFREDENGGMSCQCKLTPEDCSIDPKRELKNCACACKAPLTGPNCDCGDTLHQPVLGGDNKWQCLCAQEIAGTATCEFGGVFNRTLCRCDNCQAPAYRDASGACRCDQTNDAGTCRCTSPQTCLVGGTWNAGTCACNCPAPRTTGDGAGNCKCAGAGVRTGDDCHCVDVRACANGGTWNPDSCGCNCTANCNTLHRTQDLLCNCGGCATNWTAEKGGVCYNINCGPYLNDIGIGCSPYNNSCANCVSVVGE